MTIGRRMYSDLLNRSTSIGKYLSILIGITIIGLVIPRIVSPDGGGLAAGWDIFLGLFIIGAVSSKSRSAHIVLWSIAALMALRVAVNWVASGHLFTMAQIIYAPISVAAAAAGALLVRNERVDVQS